MSPSLYLQLVLVSLGTVVLATNPPVDAALYAKFVRYTAFSAASYADNCPTPPNGATVTNYINIDSTDTQATIFRDDAAKEVILAWRGSSSATDFAVDFNQTLINYNSVGITAANCAGCQVHGGYVNAWNSASAQTISAIQTQMSANPGYILTVTGHSLGASLASLSSASFVASSLGMSLSTYTFGQPRTGNPAYANHIDSVLPPGKMFRVTHFNDGVPQTISVADGYRHHSTEYWESADDTFSPATTVQCSGQEPPDCNNSLRGTGIGANATGINLAHINYSGMSIGNPLDGGKAACGG